MKNKLKILHRIIEKEIDTKEKLLNLAMNDKSARNYYQGSIASLNYVSHIIVKLIDDELVTN
jgi:hypothetical protein